MRSVSQFCPLSVLLPGFHPLAALLLMFAQQFVPASLASDQLHDPLANRNLSPLKQVYAAPALSFYSGDHRYQTGIQHTLANSSQEAEFSSDQSSELLILDGELQRTQLSYSRRLAERSSVSFELPWLQHSGGQMDSLIENWHAWFGLPNGNRGTRPRDKLEYVYQRNGETLIDIRSNASGVGDLAIGYQYLGSDRMNQDQSTAIHYYWNAALSVPTGSKNKLTGSGALAASLSLAVRQRSSILPGRPAWFVSAGATIFEGNGLLADIREKLLWHAQAGTSWQWNEKLALKLQLETQSSLFKSALSDMESPSVQLSAGFSRTLSKRYAMDFFITEDIDVGSAPDFGMAAKIRYTR